MQVQRGAGAVVLFMHQGPVDRAVLERLLSTSERICSEDNVPRLVRKRLFMVLVEALENLHHHAPETDRDAVWASLLRSTGAYHLLVGNPASQSAANMLEHRLDVINEMDDEALKHHYMMVLSNDGRTERGGAGLGLLTMARKSERPIRLCVAPRDPHTALLVLELQVPFTEA
jgi:hypothetical protein